MKTPREQVQHFNTFYIWYLRLFLTQLIQNAECQLLIPETAQEIPNQMNYYHWLRKPESLQASSKIKSVSWTWDLQDYEVEYVQTL